MDKTNEPKVTYATVRDALDELHIECRFNDGQKFSPVKVDNDFPELANQIANALNTAADQSRVIEVMRTALEATARASRQTLDIIQKENFVFDGSGDRWEKLAFTIYTELTQASTDAKDALAEAQRIMEGK